MLARRLLQLHAPQEGLVQAAAPPARARRGAARGRVPPPPPRGPYAAAAAAAAARPPRPAARHSLPRLAASPPTRPAIWPSPDLSRSHALTLHPHALCTQVTAAGTTTTAATAATASATTTTGGTATATAAATAAAAAVSPLAPHRRSVARRLPSGTGRSRRAATAAAAAMAAAMAAAAGAAVVAVARPSRMRRAARGLRRGMRSAATRLLCGTLHMFAPPAFPPATCTSPPAPTELDTVA